MIKFTDPQGNPVYIAPEHISGIFAEDEDAVSIAIVGDSSVYTVLGPVDEVAKKIVQYKFYQMKLNALHIAISGKMSELDAQNNAVYWQDKIGEEG